MKRCRGVFLALILVLVLALIALVLWFIGAKSKRATQDLPKIQIAEIDTLTDTLPIRSIRPKQIDTAGIAKFKAIRPRLPERERDTIPPYVYADPAGGLFYGAVHVRLHADEPCSVYLHTQSNHEWALYETPNVTVTEEEILWFYAVDTAGNRSRIKSEQYDINREFGRYCRSNMVYVQAGSKGFCVDQFEWPNRRGGLPQAMVSLYAARDSCLSVEKYLCSSQEWYLACTGIRTTRFAYGERYEPKACNTEQDKVFGSGKFPECRSYHGAMDMSGNLREWTDTRAPEDQKFYKVHGGFWESRIQSSCKKHQYSFYPQNRHLSVGFRCCSPAELPLQD